MPMCAAAHTISVVMLILVCKGDRWLCTLCLVVVSNRFEEDPMDKYQEKKKISTTNSALISGFDRTQGAKKPYEAPMLTKLGDVAALTNVSVIV